MSFPSKNGDFPYSYVSLPDGNPYDFSPRHRTMALRVTVRQPSGACFDLEVPEAKSFNALQTLKAAIAARRTARGRDNVGPPFTIAKSVQLTPIRIFGLWMFMDVSGCLWNL